MGCPQLLHGTVAKGGRSPEMNGFAKHLPQVTIFKDFDSPPFISCFRLPRAGCATSPHTACVTVIISQKMGGFFGPGN